MTMLFIWFLIGLIFEPFDLDRISNENKRFLAALIGGPYYWYIYISEWLQK